LFLKEEVLTTKGRPDIPDFPDIADIPDVPILQQKKHCLRSTVREALFEKNRFRRLVSEGIIVDIGRPGHPGPPGRPGRPGLPDRSSQAVINGSV